MTVPLFVPTAHAAYANLSADQTTHLGAGDHVAWNVSALAAGTDLSQACVVLDTTSPYSNASGAASVGRFTLLGNGANVYNLRSLLMVANPILTYEVAWYDATNDVEIGRRAPLGAVKIGVGINAIFKPTRYECSALIRPATTILAEVRLMISPGAPTAGILAAYASAIVFRLS